MAQLKKVVDPFGEVNVFPQPNGQVRVVATILMEPHREGAQTGIALDGSGSMKKLYGVDPGGGVVSSIFKKATVQNEMAPVAQKICAYLARKIDSDGGTTAIYWATGTEGSQIEQIGDLRAEEAERYAFSGPRDFGTGTQLLPAVRYFLDRFRSAPWGFYVFITDGELYDLDAVKQYSVQLARDVAAGRRNPVKFVLIGLGPEINEHQMIELDDLESGTDVDVWDRKLAAEMRVLQEIFAEVVDKNARVSDNGRILDAQGRVIKNYSDTGLPAYLTFTMPAGSTYFTLEVNGQRLHQPLNDQVSVPVAQPQAPSAPAPTVQGTPHSDLLKRPAAPSTPAPTPSPIPTPAAAPPAPPSPVAARKPADED